MYSTVQYRSAKALNRSVIALIRSAEALNMSVVALIRSAEALIRSVVALVPIHNPVLSNHTIICDSEHFTEV